MKTDRREIVATLLPGVGLVLLLALLAAGFAATLEPPERAALAAMVEPRGPLIALTLIVAAGALGAGARALYRRHVAAAVQLAEAARALLSADDAGRTLAAVGTAEIVALAGVFEAFARQRDALRADVAAQVREAARGIEQERNRLAALMAELTSSVVVCNLDGRVLLYNARARTQFRALSAAPGASAGAELLGLGRSIYAVLDRALIAHALESVQQRLARGAAHPSAQFVTGTRGGQLLRVQLAPVRAIASNPAPSRGVGDGDATALAGFVLMLDNVTREMADETDRDQLLHGLTEGSRASLGNLQAAVEILDDELDAATRERFLGVVRDEVRAMSQRIQALATHTAAAVKTRWPLEDMLATDLAAAAARRLEAIGCRVSTSEVAPGLWLKLDSFSLLQVLQHLAARLVEDYGVKSVRLRGAEQAGSFNRARLDLVWSGPGISTEIVIGWETEPIVVDGKPQALSVRDVVERHDGAFWFERERVRHESFFRFLLPLAAEAEALDAAQIVRHDSRPEVHDFDLFAAHAPTAELADRPLAELAYTVFDTETTGLDPSGGDRILQIGATRIVAGKLRREDVFDQLVDPQRGIPPAGIPIHGITPEMVAGQPVLQRVLPAFHAFAADTVLVAHNAAFDLRFLELAREECGVAFEQPVLDTLLLSAVVHPQQERHDLESIAQRLGVTILGRHTAVGDAIVTAEIFLKLLPLLAQAGITTLGQAREAAQKTWHARLKY